MKNDIADILFKYTTGEATLEETNDALKEAEAGFNLEPGRNEITPDEMALTTVGDTPEEANGFGLLDTGTGSMEKVHVTNGKLDEAINQVNHDGTTNMLAFVIIGPNRYEVKGDTLTDCESPPTPKRLLDLIPPTAVRFCSTTNAEKRKGGRS